MRFTVQCAGQTVRAFAVRFAGAVRAYVNSCAHIPVALGWMEGEWFDKDGLYLVCSTHGAAYEPDSGYCVAGPCKGRRLAAVNVSECEGNILLMEGENPHV